MAGEEEKKSSTEAKAPTPLSLEGGNAKQIDLPIEPPPATKSSSISYNKADRIKGIIGTPKVAGSTEPDSEIGTSSTSSSSSSSSIPKPDIQAITTKLDSEDKGERADTTPPDPEETDDAAGMFIDGFDALFQFFIQIFAKDTDDTKYTTQTADKTKLKKYLSRIIERAKQKFPVGWLFFGLIVLLYAPIAKKAFLHRKMVDEARARDNTTSFTGEVKRKRRRSRLNDNNDDEGFTHAEVIK